MSKLRGKHIAQRPAEERRRDMEEKLLLGLVWKPVVATMNENSTDLVSCDPPLYNSIPATPQSAKIAPRHGLGRKKKLSSCRRRAKLMTDGGIPESIKANDGSTVQMEEEDRGTNRMKKKKMVTLDTRRDPELAADDSFTEDIDEQYKCTVSFWENKLLNLDISGSTILNTDEGITKQMQEEDGSTFRVRKKKLSSSRRRVKFMADDGIRCLEEKDGSKLQTEKEKRGTNRVRRKKVMTLDIRRRTNHEDDEDESIASIRDEKLSRSRWTKLITDDMNFEEVANQNRYKVKARKNKLSTLDIGRRTRLNYDESESYLNDNESEWESDNDNESGIYSMIRDNTQDNEGILSSDAMNSWGESDKEKINLDMKAGMQNAIIHKSPGIIQYNTNNSYKLASSPTIFKLLEKVSHLHGLPGNMQTNGKDNEVRNKSNEYKKFSNKKNKRPSVKVYKRQIQNSSAQSNSFIFKVSNNKFLDQDEDSIEENPLLSTKPSMTYFTSKKTQCEETDSGISDQSDINSELITSDVNDRHNDQLQKMIRTLAQLNGEKLTRQETEFEHLRRRMQTQENSMTQLVHVTSDLKSKLDKHKKNMNLVNEFKCVNGNAKQIEHLNKDLNSNSISTSRMNIRPTSQISYAPNVHIIKVEWGE
ncbi:unnamed protein product [Meganyctiphanes norvegica]|uniref:Uncharacterized protein n=1 Tax=Meganyctiphanes norvegica TaxID=48144 RepID=A0AAV2PQ10_MEGNR